MVQTHDILIAGEGKTLYYPAENIVWGHMARLAVYKGHQLTKEDFTEIDKTEVVRINDTDYVFYNWKYSDIVEFIIKCKYTYDSQIALMLNYQMDPEKYQDKYDEMQSWRNYAKEIGRKFDPVVEEKEGKKKGK